MPKTDLPLRARLALLHAVLLAGLLGAFGTLVYFETREFLLDSTAIRVRAQAKPIIEASIGAGMPDAGHEAAWFAALARALASRDSGALAVHRDGRVVAEGRHLPEEPRAARHDATQIARALRGENEVTYIAPVNGEDHLVMLIPLRPAPGHAEVFGVAQLSVSMRPIYEILFRQRTLIVAGSLAAMAVGVALSLWMSSAVLRPLHRMIATCQRVAHGDLSQRAHLPHSGDEVGQLSAAFNDMVARLESSFGAQRRFVADAAHELRTPLTALAGSLEVMLRGSQDDRESAQRLLRGMHREVTRLTRLAEQLLDVSRLDEAVAIQLREVRIMEMVTEFVQQAHALARDRHLEIAPGADVRILADADLLKQALFNLVDNAVQHTAADGKIVINWTTTGQWLRLSVTDDGSGISPLDMPHLYEPFYRGDRSRSRRRGGTGLGLALVKRVAQAHGGEVSAGNNVPKGASFTLSLPLARSDDHHLPSLTPIDTPPPKSGLPSVKPARA